MIIAPSILSLKKDERKQRVIDIIKAGALYIHVDIMDNKFVPNITEGSSILKDIPMDDCVVDTHLMVEDPLNYLENFKESDYITFHLEAVKDPRPVIKAIKSKGIKVGMSIKPNTKVSDLNPYLKDLDLVLVISVEPGFGGQKFMESAIDKVKELDTLREQHDFDYQIEVDGGINLTNAPMLKNAGANIVVMGTFLFGHDNPKEVFKEVEDL